jgi:hypothetical protein
MSRHRFCRTADREGVIEQLAEDMWEERRASADEHAWAEADTQTRHAIRKLAADW